MQIIPDLIPTIALTLPFLVAMVALHFILFRPVLAYLEERDRVSVDARKEAEELDAASEERTTRLENELAVARKTASDLRQAARASAHEEEAKILAAARAEAEAKVAAAVAEIATQRDAAATVLQQTARELSGEIAGQVLGRPVTPEA